MTPALASPSILLLDPADILPPRANSRKDHDPGSEAEELMDEPGFAQLVRTIEKTGLLQPIGVRALHDGTYELAYGSRRLEAWKIARPRERIPCLLRQAGDFETFRDNLVENLHRRQLLPWEKAEALYELKKLAPDKATNELAAEVGMSTRYCELHIRLRRKLRPDIWELFKRFGHSLRISAKDLDRLTCLSKEEQLPRWNALVEARRKLNGGKGRGPEKHPGQLKLEKYLAIVVSIEGKSGEWKRGCAYALRVALGKRRWDYGIVPAVERARPLPVARRRQK